MRLCIFLSVLFATSLLSCKEDKKCENADNLSSKNNLIGKWEWKQTIKTTYYKATGQSTKDTIYSEDVSDIYVFEIKEKGFIKFYTNNDLKDQKCLNVANDYTTEQNGIMSYDLSLLFDQSYNDYINIKYNENDLYMETVIFGISFPYTYEETDDEQIFYKNYFQKQ